MIQVYAVDATTGEVKQISDKKFASLFEKYLIGQIEKEEVVNNTYRILEMIRDE